MIRHPAVLLIALSCALVASCRPQAEESAPARSRPHRARAASPRAEKQESETPRQRSHRLLPILERARGGDEAGFAELAATAPATPSQKLKSPRPLAPAQARRQQHPGSRAQLEEMAALGRPLPELAARNLRDVFRRFVEDGGDRRGGQQGRRRQTAHPDAASRPPAVRRAFAAADRGVLAALRAADGRPGLGHRPGPPALPRDRRAVTSSACGRPPRPPPIASRRARTRSSIAPWAGTASKLIAGPSFAELNSGSESRGSLSDTGPKARRVMRLSRRPAKRMKTSIRRSAVSGRARLRYSSPPRGSARSSASSSASMSRSCGSPVSVETSPKICP